MNKYIIIKQTYYMDDKGNKYCIDGKHVILEPTEREVEVAHMLGKLYGGEIRIIPRVNFPLGIKTPDYIVNGKRFDLKEIHGNGKYVIQGNLKSKQEQANNFIIDIENSAMGVEEATRQLYAIFNSKHFTWIDTILLVRKNKIIDILKTTN